MLKETMVPMRPKSVSTGRILEIGAAVVILLICARFAQYTLGTVFGTWDDEGYMLLSLRSYLNGHPLYSDTYTEYGPFYFFAQAFFFRLLHLPVTHDAGRLVTLITWMFSSIAGGFVVYRISRSVLLASSAMASLTVLGAIMAGEPGHPGQLILMLFMLSACVAAWAGPKGSLTVFGLVVIGIALAFTKINVGVFYFAALAHTCAVLAPPGRLRIAGLSLSLAGAAGLPYVLMHSRLTNVAGFCVAATLCGLVTFACGSLWKPETPLPWRALIRGVAGGVLAVVAIIIAVRLQGVSYSDLLKGIILDPARHPQLFLLPIDFGLVKMLWTVLVLGCTSIITWRVIQDRVNTNSSVAYRDEIGALRCIAGLAVIFLLLGQHLAWAVPFLPLGLIPADTGRRWQDLLPRLFLTDLAALQFLQAFPVAGTQASIAAAPALLWAFLCISDGSEGLRRMFKRLGSFRRETVLGGLSALTLVLAALYMPVSTGIVQVLKPVSTREPFRPQGYLYPSSKLRGAASLHLRTEVEERYQFLATSVSKNCDLLFTMPGMGSFTFWSDVPTPDQSNVGSWIRRLSLTQQSRILQVLQAHPSACVIYNAALVEFWQTRPAEVAASPLALYILNDMSSITQRDGYEIRIHPERKAAWVR
jgi:hypothetical protein